MMQKIKKFLKEFREVAIKLWAFLNNEKEITRSVEEMALKDYRRAVEEMAQYRLIVFLNFKGPYRRSEFWDYWLPTQECIAKHFGPGDFTDHVTRRFNELLHERYSPEQILLLKLERPGSPIAQTIFDPAL